MAVAGTIGAMQGMAAQGSAGALGAAQATLQLSLAGALANVVKGMGQAGQSGTGH
jgi:hypothetical protein